MTQTTNGQDLPSGAETTGRIVVALFEQRSQAEAAIRDLEHAGFSGDQIGLATQDKMEAEGLGEETAAADRPDPITKETAAGMAEGASAGALTGGVIGGLMGLISSLLVPGLGPLVVAGVLASALLGMGVGAATGGLIGALVGMGVPEEDARYFDAGLREGRTLVTVNAVDGAPEAIPILHRHGADLGPSRTGGSNPSRSYHGEERRSLPLEGYPGPERRTVGV